MVEQKVYQKKRMGIGRERDCKVSCCENDKGKTGQEKKNKKKAAKNEIPLEDFGEKRTILLNKRQGRSVYQKNALTWEKGEINRFLRGSSK